MNRLRCNCLFIGPLLADARRAIPRREGERRIGKVCRGGQIEQDASGLREDATPDPHKRRADASPRPDALGPRYAKSVSSRVVARGFDIDEFRIARTQLSQLPANRSGIAFLVEKLLPLAIGRPP